VAPIPKAHPSIASRLRSLWQLCIAL
jgi:hypothetical protein